MSAPLSDVYRTHEAVLRGESQKALNDIDSLPEYATAFIVRSEAYLEAGDVQAAETAARAALRLCPNSPRAILLLEATGAQNKGRVPKLGDLFDDDREFVAPIAQADAPKLRAMDSVAEDSLEPVDDTETPGLVSDTLARLLLQQQKYAEARKVYIQLARLHPERYEYYRSRMDELASKA